MFWFCGRRPLCGVRLKRVAVVFVVCASIHGKGSRQMAGLYLLLAPDTRDFVTSTGLVIQNSFGDHEMYCPLAFFCENRSDTSAGLLESVVFVAACTNGYSVVIVA